MANVVEGTLVASGARTGAVASDPGAVATANTVLGSPSNPARDIEIAVDTTAFVAGSVVVTLEGYDDAAGAFKALLSTAVIVATGTVYLRYGLDFPIVANASAFGIVPKRWRVTATGNGSTQTYSVSARLYCA